jgi:hypothetical protein
MYFEHGYDEQDHQRDSDARYMAEEKRQQDHLQDPIWIAAEAGFDALDAQFSAGLAKMEGESEIEEARRRPRGFHFPVPAGVVSLPSSTVKVHEYESEPVALSMLQTITARFGRGGSRVRKVA